MKIGLIRHGKVLYRDPFFTTGKLFDQGRLNYDASDIVEATLKINPADFPVCYCSSKKRAVLTAKAIYPGIFHITDELIEVPNGALFPMEIKFPTLMRAAIGRVAWWLNYSKMPETRAQSNQRANHFLTHLLEETQQNTLLVTHGFFMQALQRELHKLGFKGHCPFYPPNAVLYTYERK
jgi:broad specificity phosphatase PhoE